MRPTLANSSERARVLSGWVTICEIRGMKTDDTAVPSGMYVMQIWEPTAYTATVSVP